MITETLAVYRGATDKMGNPHKAPHGTVDGIFGWGSGTPYQRNQSLKGESASLAVELYVPRDADVKARDRIARTSGDQYAVIGHAMWDQQQPQTGRDFGWKVFQVEAISG